VNPIAVGINDLSPASLSRALDVSLRSATAERMGKGQTAAMYRLTIDAESVPPTLIANLAAGDEAARRRVEAGHRKEVGLYAQLARTVDVRTPRCWYGAISDDACTFTLLLDDLAPRNPGVQALGCS
jgi:hypothetical protein